MSDEKMVSERDVVLRERAAFCEGARWWVYGIGAFVANAETDAAKRYPLPKVKRPRVLTDEWGYEWRYRGDEMEYRARSIGSPWKPFSDCGDAVFMVNARRVRVWHDLVTNPTEELDDDGGAR